MLVEWSTALVTATATGLVQAGFWFLFRRSIDRLESDNKFLKDRVQDLEQNRVEKLEKELEQDTGKRKEVYLALEHIRLNWMSKGECQKQHEAAGEQASVFMGAVLKLERVQAEVTRLVSWVDDISKEQISAGKDLAALSERLEHRRAK